MHNGLLLELSERQKACLRLVGQGMSSKEIAHSVGLSPQTVDTYLKAAISRLGATNRRDAARKLAALELPQNLGPPSPAIVPGVSAQQTGPATAWREWRAIRILPPLGGRPNELGAAARTLAVLRIAAIGTVVVLAIALLIAAGFRTFS